MSEHSKQYSTIDMIDFNKVELSQELLGSYSPLALRVYERGRRGHQRLHNPTHAPFDEMSVQIPAHKYIERMNREMFEYICDVYDVTPDRAEDILFNAFSDANRLVTSTLAHALPEEHATSFGLRNEVLSFVADEPGDRIWQMAHQARDDREEFQLFQQLQLAHPLIDLHASYPQRRVKGLLYRMQGLLNEDLYNGESHKGNDDLHFATWHNPEDNAFLGYDPVIGGVPLFHNVSARRLKDGNNSIHIMTNFREKDPHTAMGKLLAKTLMNGDPVLDMHRHVQDLAGLRLTVLGGTRERDMVYQRVLDVLNERMIKQAREPLSSSKLHIADIEDDCHIDGRSKNGHIDWRRSKVWLIDPSKGTIMRQPIELVVDDYGLLMNGSYYIGDKNDPRLPEAHLEFERKRAQNPLFGFLFPTDVYRSAYESIDIEGEMAKKRDENRRALRIHPEAPQELVLGDGIVW
ncbi:hypothetical protein IPM65_05310 [Candidatus Roizmanbacteria bacterium]|nr:MAG: hypothetical protein IPM65_05310 [Candidatus Roizmanbacteria bacterium]